MNGDPTFTLAHVWLFVRLACHQGGKSQLPSVRVSSAGDCLVLGPGSNRGAVRGWTSVVAYLSGWIGGVREEARAEARRQLKELLSCFLAGPVPTDDLYLAAEHALMLEELRR